MRISEGRTVKLSDLREDLVVEDGSKIECTGEGMSLKVEGDIRCEGTVEFTGSVSCANFFGDDCRITTRSLSCQSLSISDGSLEVNGDLSARSIDVDEKLFVSGRTESETIEVGGVLELASVKARSIEVGGKFRASSDVEVDDIDVGGTVEISGKINSKSVDVGGKVKLNGGIISSRIDVGGIFESTGELEFGDIDVGGIIILGGSSKGGNVDVGGKLQVRGDLQFKSLDVGGTADVKGRAEGEKVDLGGRLRVNNDLILKDSLDVGGVAEVSGDAEAKRIDIGGRFQSKTLKAETAKFSGQVMTEGGIFASGLVQVERKCNVKGWIRSLDSVLIETRGEVEYVSAPKVRMGDRVRAKGVYAESLDIDDRVEITEEAMYTGSLNYRSSGYKEKGYGVEPRKVESIPQEKGWSATRPAPRQ